MRSRSCLIILVALFAFCLSVTGVQADSIDKIQKKLASKDLDERASGILALKKKGDLEAATLLVNMLLDEHP